MAFSEVAGRGVQEDAVAVRDFRFFKDVGDEPLVFLGAVDELFGDLVAVLEGDGMWRGVGAETIEQHGESPAVEDHGWL